jgi:gamma-glutamylcyclotransferase (GGCT)/AIG2-like uncharacterized protein YtfP
VPLLFSYGTLQQEQVQLATFGRRLIGKGDELPGFAPASVDIHANVITSQNPDSRVPGTVFEVTDAELASADTFELQFSYKRILVTLASGREAWVYVHAV